ncbi:MAG TPA: SPOR domain-containing protein [Sphingomicrobium sp.]|nr:SPOR domain-containing protein [Sphingomicrobium sp.]
MVKSVLRARLIAAPLALMLSLTAAPLAAQSYSPESPATALSRHIRVLASSPRDFNALIGAGRAALELGDVQSAAGFFGRAEEAYPNAPAAKAGLGAAMAHMGDADGAIFYFNQASRMGAQPLTLALDRGLARDLSGDLGGAQSDYRLAISTIGSDEARRRLALSLAIARDRKGALDALQPLLNRRDPAALRTRAFVLALVGDTIGAAQAIEAQMPGGSARFAPFFRTLPNLSAGEKAAAVHLGIFPEDAATRVAQAPPKTSPPVRVAQASPPPAPRPSPPASEPVRIATAEPVSSPSFSLPSATRVPPAATTPVPDPGEPIPEPLVDVPTAEAPGIKLAEAEPVPAEDKLGGIDQLLSAIEEVPPPSQPKVETSKGPTKAEKAAETKKLAEKKKREEKLAAEKKARAEKLAAEKKAREEAARLGVSGTYWVQLAGGSNQDRMATEYKRLSAQAGRLLKSRPGYVTEGKEYFRLLVGPFDSKAEAQAFVNKLAKEGVDGFSWTRTPPRIKIEKL